MPLTEPTMKSVQHVSGGDPFNEYAYSLNQAAAALGKSQLTFKRWVGVGIVPEPTYEDTSHRYAQFLGWEIEAMAIPLGEHFDTFDYLHTKHTETVSAVWAALDNVRRKRGRNHVRATET